MSSSAEETLKRVRTALEGLEIHVSDGTDSIPCLAVAPRLLHETLSRLKSHASFEVMTMITCVDRYGAASITALDAEERFEVVHQLHSIACNDRVRVKTRVGGQTPAVSTCTDLWPGASFMEREAYDLFGVEFEGHPNLERLLMPEGYDHHPLRKDFPHKGIEPDRLYREWDRARRAREAASSTGVSR